MKRNALNNDAGNKLLRRFRLERGLSQEELALATAPYLKKPITEYAVWCIENGRTEDPRPKTKRAIAAALGVAVIDVFPVPDESKDGQEPKEAEPPAGRLVIPAA